MNEKETNGWHLCLFNKRRRTDDEQASATLYYGFNGSINLPVDRRFVEILKEHYEIQLAEKRREFESL